MKAVRIGAVFRDKCAAGTSAGTVHSVFRRVVNIDVQGDLIALALTESGGSSRFLTVAKMCPFKAGEPCVFTPEQASIGNAVIDLREVPLWRSPLPPDTRAALSLGTGTSGETARRFKAALDRRAGNGVYPNCLITPETADRWVGFGPGLTPSGDDALVGFLSIYNHLGGDRLFAEALLSAVSQRLHATTALSARLLRSALCCDYHEAVAIVVAIVCGVTDGDLETALARLFGIGASSGADIAHGMLLALNTIIEQSKARAPFDIPIKR
ncbi:MAG: DUF2877 domain-containing protein [Clostridiales bacterium]|jgi:hypothetical protein|nr:DUF2877 domain-containing protein [Clostridiales bacterium]